MSVAPPASISSTHVSTQPTPGMSVRVSLLVGKTWATLAVIVARSTWSGGSCVTSPWTHRTWSAHGLQRATSSDAPAGSIPVTSTPWLASMQANVPVPQPMSSTRAGADLRCVGPLLDRLRDTLPDRPGERGQPCGMTQRVPPAAAEGPPAPTGRTPLICSLPQCWPIGFIRSAFGAGRAPSKAHNFCKPRRSDDISASSKLLRRPLPAFAIPPPRTMFRPWDRRDPE